MDKKLIQTICYTVIAVIALGFTIGSSIMEKKSEEKFDASVKQITESSSGKTATASSSQAEDKSAEKAEKEKQEKEKNSKEQSKADKADKAEKAESQDAEASSSESAKAAPEKTGPFYSYTVTVDDGTLVMYDDPVEKNEVERIPAGYTGYVIEKSDDYRSLVLYKGMVGYCSNLYMEITEISPEQYPDELLGVSAANVGSLLFDGAKVGEIENSNPE